MATRARFAASDSAVARPIPDEAPVTSATFPLKSKELFITEALNQFLTSRELHRWFQGYAFYVAGKRKQNQSTQRGEQPRDHQHRYVRKVIEQKLDSQVVSNAYDYRRLPFAPSRATEQRWCRSATQVRD